MAVGGGEGAEQGASLEAAGEDVCAEDQVGEGLVFGISGVGKEVGGNGHRSDFWGRDRKGAWRWLL